VETGNTGFNISKELTSPTDLKISSSNGSASLSWNYSSKGSLKIEFYRIRGECVKGGAKCGTYINDIWNLPSNEGSPMTLQVTQAMLGNPPSGGQWKFQLSANNQSKGLRSAEISFDPVTLG
jgi:hypothetical protein